MQDPLAHPFRLKTESATLVGDVVLVGSPGARGVHQGLARIPNKEGRCLQRHASGACSVDRSLLSSANFSGPLKEQKLLSLVHRHAAVEIGAVMRLHLLQRLLAPTLCRVANEACGGEDSGPALVVEHERANSSPCFAITKHHGLLPKEPGALANGVGDSVSLRVREGDEIALLLHVSNARDISASPDGTSRINGTGQTDRSAIARDNPAVGLSIRGAHFCGRERSADAFRGADAVDLPFDRKHAITMPSSEGAQLRHLPESHRCIGRVLL